MLHAQVLHSRLGIHVALLAALALAFAAPTAHAAPDRPCGVIKVRGSWLQVKTFGAAGPSCKTAKRVIRKTYKRKKQYRGYDCERGRFPLKWGCYHRNGSKNALAYYYDK
jgi:hypothetical protein